MPSSREESILSLQLTAALVTAAAKGDDNCEFLWQLPRQPGAGCGERLARLQPRRRTPLQLIGRRQAEREVGRELIRRKWPAWWEWELEFSPHLLKRMVDRRFTEVDLRAMLERGADYHKDLVPGRFRVKTRHRRREWIVIVEPDAKFHLLVIVTAFPLD